MYIRIATLYPFIKKPLNTNVVVHAYIGLPLTLWSAGADRQFNAGMYFGRMTTSGYVVTGYSGRDDVNGGGDANYGD